MHVRDGMNRPDLAYDLVRKRHYLREVFGLDEMYVSHVAVAKMEARLHIRRYRLRKSEQPLQDAGFDVREPGRVVVIFQSPRLALQHGDFER